MKDHVRREPTKQMWMNCVCKGIMEHSSKHKVDKLHGNMITDQ